MEEIIDRFLQLLDEEDRKMTWLEKTTGIEAKRWHNVKQRRVMRTSELEAIQKAFPEYKVWLSTGEEYPEAGQISPMTKKAQQSLKQAPKAG